MVKTLYVFYALIIACVSSGVYCIKTANFMGMAGWLLSGFFACMALSMIKMIYGLLIQLEEKDGNKDNEIDGYEFDA